MEYAVILCVKRWWLFIHVFLQVPATKGAGGAEHKIQHGKPT